MLAGSAVRLASQCRHPSIGGGGGDDCTSTSRGNAYMGHISHVAALGAGTPRRRTG